jgi:multiple sugar transport system substrate-binding protein
LTSSAASSLLAACGGSSNSSAGNGPALNIVWENHSSDTYKVYQNLVDDFNQTNGHGIHVTYISGPNDSTQLHSIFLNMLTARGSAIDVMSMDIIWPAEFALNQWVVPIDNKWPASERAKYLTGPIQGCSFEDQIWAAPFYTDAGLLYYRKDLISTPPSSWEALTDTATRLQANGSVKSGYVWQGASYEGLVCDFAEVLYGYGGTVLDPQNSKSVTINSTQATDALTAMVNWVGTISPDDVLQGKEENMRMYWEKGQTAFMRNWTYAYALDNASTSKVAHKFDISSIPYGGTNRVGHSAIGGWQLGINAFSKPDKIDASWQFIQYMLSEKAQKRLALEASLAPTLKSVYQDRDVLTKNPFFKNLGSVLQTALPRPTSPRYADLSLAIQSRVSSALMKQHSPAEALAGLESDLKVIVNS